ncbi:MAG: hypothetical protein NTV01_16220 [Bacteroidia bacterium]|nr:hypothetical protein [Bacteroidia bacterium]
MPEESGTCLKLGIESILQRLSLPVKRYKQDKMYTRVDNQSYMGVFDETFVFWKEIVHITVLNRAIKPYEKFKKNGKIVP